MVGVKRKRLVFVPAKLTDLTKGLTPEAEAQIADLHTRIKDIYACVNMDVRLAWMIFVFDHLNLYLFVVWTRFTHDSRRNTSCVAENCLNSKKKRSHSWLVKVMGSKFLTPFRDMNCGWVAMSTTRLLSMRMWWITRVSQSIKHRIVSQPSQTACFCLVDPEKSLSRLHRATYS